MIKDDLDREIIRLLAKDGRQANTAIASALGVSEGTVRARIAKLVKNKVIRRFTVETANDGFAAIILVKTDPARHTEEIVRGFLRLGGVKKAYEVSGPYDAVLLANAESAEAYNELIEKIRTTKGVLQTESLVALKVH